jgi:hypothetical protein
MIKREGKKYNSFEEMIAELNAEYDALPWWRKALDAIQYILKEIWGIISPKVNIRRLRFLWQRLTRGFDDSVTWDLDGIFVKFILPRLKRFREIEKLGVPGKLCYLSPEDENKLTETENDFYYSKVHAQWNEILDKMILAFELIEKDELSIENYEEQNKKIEEGLNLFVQYFRDLWW